jgi:hypothetical protein
LRSQRRNPGRRDERENRVRRLHERHTNRSTK